MWWCALITAIFIVTGVYFFFKWKEEKNAKKIIMSRILKNTITEFQQRSFRHKTLGLLTTLNATICLIQKDGLYEKYINRLEKAGDQLATAIKNHTENLKENSPIELRSTIKDIYESVCSKHLFVKVEMDCPEEAWILGCNGITQTFANLLINSCEAIGDRDDGLIKINIQKNENRIWLTIRDNGCGIAPKDIKKIWHPHFTTKTDSSRGIGLFLVKNLLELANAQILSVDSQIGENAYTEICISFQEAKAPVKLTPKKPLYIKETTV